MTRHKQDYERSARRFCAVHNKIWDPKTNSCRPKKSKKKTSKKTKKKTKQKGGEKQELNDEKHYLFFIHLMKDKNLGIINYQVIGGGSEAVQRMMMNYQMKNNFLVHQNIILKQKHI